MIALSPPQQNSNYFLNLLIHTQSTFIFSHDIRIHPIFITHGWIWIWIQSNKKERKKQKKRKNDFGFNYSLSPFPVPFLFFVGLLEPTYFVLLGDSDILRKPRHCFNVTTTLKNRNNNRQAGIHYRLALVWFAQLRFLNFWSLLLCISLLCFFLLQYKSWADLISCFFPFLWISREERSSGGCYCYAPAVDWLIHWFFTWVGKRWVKDAVASYYSRLANYEYYKSPFPFQVPQV